MHTHLNISFSVCIMSHIYFFRVDHLVLDNQLVNFSLKRVTSSVTHFTQLSVVLCVWLKPHCFFSIYFGISIVALFVEFLFRQSRVFCEAVSLSNVKIYMCKVAQSNFLNWRNKGLPSQVHIMTTKSVLQKALKEISNREQTWVIVKKTISYIPTLYNAHYLIIITIIT